MVQEVPFLDFWKPRSARFYDEMQSQHPGLCRWLAPEAWEDVLGAYLGEISSLGELALSKEFHIFRALQDPCFVPEPTEDLSKKLYQEFVQRLQNGGSKVFFSSYPVLDRMLDIKTHAFKNNLATFLQALENDHLRLETAFFGGKKIGSVARLQMKLSDPHNGGKSVLRIRFVSNVSLVYKPRDITMEIGWNRLLRWINHRSSEIQFKTIDAIACQGHGWCECVDAKDCADESEVQTYYRRAGAMIGLVYAMGGTDCHMENIIACGSDPVLVDAETLMNPFRKQAGAKDGDEIFRSVLSTGFLPLREKRESDFSALGAGPEQETKYRMHTWQCVNSNSMSPVFAVKRIPENRNAVRLKGILCPAENFLPQMMGGFELMYRLLLAERDPLLSENGPLNSFVSGWTRCLLRMTQLYAQLHYRLRFPRFLTGFALRSGELEVLKIAYLASGQSLNLYDAELVAMERTDIPYFSVPVTGRDLWADGKPVAQNWLAESPFKTAQERLRTMSEQDCQEQKERIRLAFASVENG